MEAGAGPGDGAPDKNDLEETSGDKAPKSDEEVCSALSSRKGKICSLHHREEREQQQLQLKELRRRI